MLTQEQKGKFAFRTAFSLRTLGVVVCYDLLTVENLHGVRKEVRNEIKRTFGMKKKKKVLKYAEVYPSCRECKVAYRSSSSICQ